jgi:hypothetical protein
VAWAAWTSKKSKRPKTLKGATVGQARQWLAAWTSKKSKRPKTLKGATIGQARQWLAAWTSKKSNAQRIESAASAALFLWLVLWGEGRDLRAVLQAYVMRDTGAGAGNPLTRSRIG